MSGRWLSIITRFLGVSSIIGIGVELFLHRMTVTELLLLALALPAIWLRIRLKPAGHITLMPVVIFVSFAVAARHVPFVVATIASLFGALVLQHQSIGIALEAIGEEVAPVILASALSEFLMPPRLTGYPWQSMLIIAVLAYVVGWVAVVMLKAKVEEGAGVRSFLSASGRTILNFLFFGVVASGLVYLVHVQGRDGYFTLTLATIALAEFYYPWKLRSDRGDIEFASLTMIAQAIDLKDSYTGAHVWKTSRTAVRVARRLGLPEADIGKIRRASILHDIGKVGVSGKIIRKPSALDPDEMTAMRQHPVIGAKIMQPAEMLADAAEIVHHHHEHFDGSGYPDRLKGKQIPLGSRILLVADAFNAITDNRSYRPARSKEEALKILRDGAGTQFDPLVVGAIESIAAFL